MLSIHRLARLLAAVAVLLFAWDARAQSFRVQCPAGTLAHPADVTKDPNVVGTAQALYSTYTLWGRTDGLLNPTPAMANPAIKCQQISGGDGFATMGDGTQTFLFGFGPLSGLVDIYNALPGTEPASVFMQPSPTGSGTPSNLVGLPSAVTPDNPATTFNGAIGLGPDQLASTFDANGNFVRNCSVNSTDPLCLDGHVDPRAIMDVGVMNASEPAPLMAIDEDDEFFLTLTNVGQIMRPDLFEQHTVHFHGYPNASSFYDGVPDASIAINVGGSFSYYYLAPDAGTYFWHCHISPPEHLQMGMVGQLYVRPRQNRVTGGLRAALAAYEGPANVALLTSPTATAAAKTAEYERLRKSCNNDILCSTPLPPSNTATRAATGNYAYNDGDGSTYYDVEYPIQIHGFDPSFHFVGMTFNPESFTDMKDKYFLLNGRSYPDTVGGGASTASANVPSPMQTMSTDGTMHTSQPLPSVINIPAGGKALLRISDLSVTEYSTLASLGIPMRVIALNARLLRDQSGNDMTYLTNSITLAGGESLDVILDATGYAAGQKFFLYTPNLDHLSNDAENFGGLMTEVNICNSVDPTTKTCG